MTLQLYLLKFGFKERAWLGKMMKKSWLRTDDVDLSQNTSSQTILDCINSLV